MSKKHIVGLQECADPYCTYCHPKLKGKVEDMVNHPSHYQMELDSGVSVEALEIIQASLTREEYIGYLRGNILKYNMRKNYKHGEQDILKACFYSDRLKIILETTC